MNTATPIRVAITLLVVSIAALLCWFLWQHYMYSPWTRDGRVQVRVIQIAPDVSGLVRQVAVGDNQLVHKGDLLFVIDQSRFTNAVMQAEADQEAAEAAARSAGADIRIAEASAARARAEFAMREAESSRRARIPQAVSEEIVSNARSSADAAAAALRAARASTERASAGQQQLLANLQRANAALELARLNLQRTEVRAPTDGYITNLNLYPGDYAHTGQAYMALIDRHHLWVYGYFEETKLPRVNVGDRVEVRLMSGLHTEGVVDSIARGIADRDNPTGANLLAEVNPTFSWVRLAQRVPVRVRLDADKLPPDTVLAAGMTATLVLRPE
ncbi:HlyD family secretion protein [Microbulbifer sp. SAOS-129_SWC]|uniref:HlyD family secretion protein n=1 Tax=Microbulbifer sp. SAOS-129_SWC TaxID=3145235 RepID=UPI0032165F0C